jgi:hypothetical protein
VELKHIVERDKWTVVERQDSEGKQFIRFRYEFNENMDLSALREGVHVFWDYTKNSDGLPDDPNELEQMEKFENDIVTLLEKDLDGILVSILTLSGYRHWTFCIKNIEVFLNYLNSIPQSDKPYPLELEKTEGSGWDYLFNNIYAYKNA